MKSRAKPGGKKVITTEIPVPSFADAREWSAWLASYRLSSRAYG